MSTALQYLRDQVEKARYEVEDMRDIGYAWYAPEMQDAEDRLNILVDILKGAEEAEERA